MNDELRDAARARLQAKQNFWRQLIVAVAIIIVCNVVWFISDYRGSYWPIWPMLGMAIWIVSAGINAFSGRRQITESDVDEEVKRMGGDR